MSFYSQFAVHDCYTNGLELALRAPADGISKAFEPDQNAVFEVDSLLSSQLVLT